MFDIFKKTKFVTVHPLSILLFFLIGAGLYFVYQVRAIVTLVFLAFILMTAFHPTVDRVHKSTRLPRPLSILIVYLTVLSVFGGLLALILPPLGNELYLFIKAIDLPFLQEELRNLRFTVSELSALAQQVGSSVGMIFQIISQTFSGLITFFTLIVLSFYMMLERDTLHEKIVWFTREKSHLNLAKKFLDDLEEQLGGWVRGQIVLMLVIGTVTYVGLELLGVPYALPLAVVAGLLEILPNIGPTVAAIPGIIFAFVSGGYVLAAITTLFYLVMQQIENNFLVPKIMQSNADVNPLVAITAIMMGVKLGGVVGALLSVPAYIVIRSLYGLWYHRK